MLRLFRISFNDVKSLSFPFLYQQTGKFLAIHIIERNVNIITIQAQHLVSDPATRDPQGGFKFTFLCHLFKSAEKLVLEVGQLQFF